MSFKITFYFKNNRSFIIQDMFLKCLSLLFFQTKFCCNFDSKCLCIAYTFKKKKKGAIS